MFRKYFQLAIQITNTLNSFKNPVFLGVNYENHMSKRWAGHAKWQNIKSTKTAADAAKAATFTRISKKIGLAVKEGGEDIATNNKLKALWEEAKKLNMPKSTFEKSINAAKSKVIEKPYWTIFKGPKGIIVGFEVSFANKNPSFLQGKFSHIRKLNFKLEPYFQEICSERGIIITEPISNVENSYEKAVEDAIEIGIDEVFENDDKTLIFECLPERVASMEQKLEEKGYNVLSATVELDFKNFIELNQEEVNSIETAIDKTKNLHSEILRASYNAKLP